ncbi:hypothetical protein MPNT_10323 [Candidatus Methylacidithermus pantelleriae]|uniref:Uncharacterized protein n=1 Tax=Candidatus Methylacidithermus pantelleriae TaxID=2744239 RepID=A0A8J2BHH8_9BACT|nr:hypothetical protein MPNT_10323 [Candidatus Methylacidithermus pantelleriae]
MELPGWGVSNGPFFQAREIWPNLPPPSTRAFSREDIAVSCQEDVRGVVTKGKGQRKQLIPFVFEDAGKPTSRATVGLKGCRRWDLNPHPVAGTGF